MKHQFHPEITSIQMPFGAKSLKEEGKEVEIHSKEFSNEEGFNSQRDFLEKLKVEKEKEGVQ